jgi:hypothetical protein
MPVLVNPIGDCHVFERKLKRMSELDDWKR